ncbi:hypothetical protein K7432_002834 [Basidiobolus ranarum]|uniref:Uncharacterized protein n=1 Tax=Basidiobolus ranarum TaxID=34480 RepID=A0ABR2W737_9FUNG
MAAWFVQNILTSAPKRLSFGENGGHIMEHTKSLHLNSSDVNHVKELTATSRITRHRRGLSDSKPKNDFNAGLAIAMCGGGYAGGAAAYYMLDRNGN